MFSVETTYYCASCRKVKVKDWQFSEGVKALEMYENVIDKHYDNGDIITSFVELRWTRVDEVNVYPKSATIYYYHKSIDTSVSGVDSIVCVNNEMRKIFDSMHNTTRKEVA